jgi:hypothetical protein
MAFFTFILEFYLKFFFSYIIDFSINMIIYFIFVGNHKRINGMLTNDSLKSNPKFSIPLTVNVENKVKCLIIFVYTFNNCIIY